MKKLHTHLALILISVFGFSLCAKGQATSDFNLNSEGWTIVNIDGTGITPNLAYSPSNGNPLGTISAKDSTGTGIWYFNAGPEFIGNISTYYGGGLTFDMKENSTAGPNIGADIIIVKSDDTRICYNIPGTPNTLWKNYVVPLDEYYWNYTSPYGLPVTASDMLLYLSDVKALYIKGDVRTDKETTWLDDVILSTTPVILPVELSEFSGAVSASNNAELDWTTLSEKDCRGFDVEKSTGTDAEFSSIGFVAGNGTSSDMHTYTFTDDSFTSSSYYRLKQSDNDGNFFYSKTIYIAAQTNTSVALSTKLYPNPAADIVYLGIAGQDKIIHGYQVTDMMGNIVDASSGQDFSNRQTSLDVSRFSTGMYMVTLFSDTGNETLPLQIMH